MSANFQPEVYPYKETGSFRFWCQKVLPLVYDDSLSYYELLCKVVKYLNDVIANVDGLHDDVLSTNQAFYDLQNFVNDYFDNLDVQVEINTKLDAMAVDGTLSELISPFVSAEIGDVVASQIGDVVGAQIGDTVASQIGDVVAEQIATPTATAVTAWLNQYVDPVGSAVVVDSSLEIQGAAADAKTTGDMIGKIISPASGTDLNTLTTRGFYRLGYSATYVNSPEVSEANKFKFVQVSVQGANIFQYYVVYKSSTQCDGYYRTWDGNHWGAWLKVFSASDLSSIMANISMNVAVESGTDLNTLTTRGFYKLSYSGTYVNSPVVDDTDTFKFVEVLLEGTQLYQRYTLYRHYNPKDYVQYVRIYDGLEWKAWVKGFDSAELDKLLDSYEVVGHPDSGTDLNTLTDRGFYKLGYSASFVNAPIEDESDSYKFLEVFVQGPQFFQRYVQYKNTSPRFTAEYLRVYDGTSWKPWIKCFDSTELAYAYKKAITIDTPMESFVRASVSSQSGNSGLKLRIASYNLAQFNNDTETYITDTKLRNLRKVLNEIDADVLCTQEDREYIDSGNTQASRNYVYNPKYPFVAGLGGVAIKSKVEGTNDYVLRLSGQRAMRAYLLAFDSIKLLMVSTHPIANYNNTGRDSAESIAMRATEYQEIFEWCNGEISLNKVDGSGAVYAPTHTHCIIGADMNSCTDTDKNNLATLASANDFILGNGGYIGWFVTNPRHEFSIDNIIVTENVVINRIESLYTKYDDLYSDHVPVVADVTLI